MIRAGRTRPSDAAPGSNPVILADRRPIVIGGFSQLLPGSPFFLAAACSSLTGLREALLNTNCRLVVSDLEIDGGTANDVLDICTEREVPVLLFSHDMHPGYLERAWRSGGAGWLEKSATGPELVATMIRVVEGKKAWPRRLLRQLSGANVSPEVSDNREFPLTARELEVLRLFANGFSNRRIADQLGIGFETAKDHVQRILEKIGAGSRTEAAVLACRKGIA